MNQKINLKYIIKKYNTKINWFILITNNLNNKYLYKYFHRILNKEKLFISLVENIKLTVDFIEEFIDQFTYKQLLKNQIHIGYYKIQYFKDRYM